MSGMSINITQFILRKGKHRLYAVDIDGLIMREILCDIDKPSKPGQYIVGAINYSEAEKIAKTIVEK
jgi:hypothetical protein